MPVYAYGCECGHSEDVYAKITDNVEPPTCPCGKPMSRDWGAGRIGSRNQDYRKPIEMFSVALNDKESIEDFQRRNPGVRISTNRRDPLYGVPIAESRAQKLSILANEGYVEKN